MGLNIARELIWLNLGRMAVDTEPGHGSTFSFTLPPDDAAVILHRYFERLEELDDKPLALVALRARSTGDADASGEIRRFLGYTPVTNKHASGL